MPDPRSQEAVNRLMADYGITRPTAEFIYDQRSVPDVAEFPEETPPEDLISVLMKTQGMSQYEAGISLAIKQNALLTSRILEERVILDPNGDYDLGEE